jgi:hypothetical protein
MPRLSRVLIVAHETADTPELKAAVAKRAAEGSCLFTLLVPAAAHGLHRVTAPEDHGVTEAQRRLAVALPLLCEAADADVRGVRALGVPVTSVIGSARSELDSPRPSPLPRG